MAKTAVIHPNLLVIQYIQEPEDPDYGSCLWLRCTLNLDAHSITIESDCGNYSYGGFCTPDFLKFCSQLGKDEGYLLGKMSKRTDIDERETMGYLHDLFDENLKGIPKECDSDEFGDETQMFWEDVEVAVSSYSASTDIVDSIVEFLNVHDMTLDCDEYDIYECICYDYPINAKKAIEVFCSRIVPVLAEQVKGVKSNG